MSSNKSNGPRDEFVAVINTDTRLYQLAYLDDHEPRNPKDPVRFLKPNVIKLAPGMNFMRASVLARCLKEEDFEDGPLQIEDVKTMAPSSAMKVAERTTSRMALNKWLGLETRTKVRQAIQKRLEASGVK